LLGEGRKKRVRGGERKTDQKKKKKTRVAPGPRERRGKKPKASGGPWSGRRKKGKTRPSPLFSQSPGKKKEGIPIQEEKGEKTPPSLLLLNVKKKRG